MCIQYIISISSVERRGLPADGAGDRRAGSHHAAVPARVKTIYIYIYMYVCIYMYIYIYIYTHLSLSLSLSIYISLSKKYIYIYIYIYIYTCICIYGDAAVPSRASSSHWEAAQRAAEVGERPGEGRGSHAGIKTTRK